MKRGDLVTMAISGDYVATKASSNRDPSNSGHRSRYFSRASAMA